jgi:hypothetical protein
VESIVSQIETSPKGELTFLYTEEEISTMKTKQKEGGCWKIERVE